MSTVNTNKHPTKKPDSLKLRRPLTACPSDHPKEKHMDSFLDAVSKYDVNFDKKYTEGQIRKCLL